VAQAGRELAIGDVVRAKSGDTSALCSDALRAHFTLAAPAGFIRHRMADMRMQPAMESSATTGIAGMSARGGSWSSGMVT
jgi:hypothetical protein